MKHRVEIDPSFGDVICEIIEKNTGRRVEIVLIICPVEDDGKLGRPSFLTSQPPEITEQIIIQIAGGFAFAGKPIIDGVHVKDN
jgi:hypothetical protein